MSEPGLHTIHAEFEGSKNWASSGSDGIDIVIDPRSGKEIQINTYTKRAQMSPALATLTGGDVVAVWQSSRQDKSGWGVFAQRFSAGLKTKGREFQVPDRGAGNQSAPAIGALTNGGFVIVWQADGRGVGIHARLFNKRGKPVGRAFRVNSTTPKDQAAPAVAGLPGGKFVITWQSSDREGFGIYGQVFKSNGAPQGRTFQVNSQAAYDQTDPALAVLNKGRIVIAWVSENEDGSGSGIIARRFKPNGRPQGRPFAVNETVENDQLDPVVVALGDGGFVIAWVSADQDGDGLGVFGQRFNRRGKPSGRALQVHVDAAGDQQQPVLVGLSEGGFLALWASGNGKGFDIVVRHFDNKVVPVGDPFQVNLTMPESQLQPSATPLKDGSALASWTSDEQDGSKEGVFGIRLDLGK